MDIAEMTVCDADGSTTNVGARVRADNNNPYMFYALSGSTVFIVNILMPLGGAETGLYRFPKIGEKVLAAYTNGNTGHLLGYVPSRAQPFDSENATMDTLIKNQGEVFRYQKTGTNSADNKYSEIGFYNEQTQWNKEGEATPPPIDRINIQSTGDIHERAQNHHQTSANRYELLVNCEAVDHTGSEKPMGDDAGDDSRLYAGDAHIRAQNRVVIKAGEELRLQVGRSAIVISDDGITITSKKTQKNVAVPWDTVLNLTPRDGITMFGQNVNIGAAYNFSLRESAGGAVSSLGGVMRLCARDLLAQSYCKLGYQANTTDFIKHYTATSKGMQSGKGDVPPYTSLVPSLVAAFGTVNWGYYASTTNYSDPAGDYAAYCGTLLQILSLTYTSLDLSMSEDLKTQNGGRDAFNLAALADQQETMQEMLDYIDNAADPVRATHNSFMHLTHSADAVLSGYDNERLSVNMIDSNVPLAGTNKTLLAKETARLQNENSAEGVMRLLLQNEKQRIEEGALWTLGISDKALKKRQEL
ncbi:MAG: hypothetical protein LBT01_00550 [Spirochaetaceae bacterium]|jgi:hypothetical protein|nr:hypothetical protein [Spirochaetaceae bacterium]